MDIYKIARKNILNFKPYSSARSEYTGSSGILLDANENAFRPVVGGDYNRYPDPLQLKLKEQISNKKNIPPDRIFLGNGSDEAIDLLIRAFCEPGKDMIMVFPPTYGMYKVCADINDISVCEIALQPNFQLSLDKITAALESKIKIIFLCSPNNPTGNLLKTEDILALLADRNTLIVVDEAYIDFAEAEGLLKFLADNENLIILQTFSKSWGLAGIRLGMAFGHQNIIGLLNKIKYPYNINLLTQEIALKALQNPERNNTLIRKILEQRVRLVEALKSLKIVDHIFPSQANFILVRFKDAQRVFSCLFENNIIVRDRSSAVHCENCLRITVGTPSENKPLIDILHQLKG